MVDGSNESNSRGPAVVVRRGSRHSVTPMASVEASVEGCRQRFGTRRWRIDKKRRLVLRIAPRSLK